MPMEIDPGMPPQRKQLAVVSEVAQPVDVAILIRRHSNTFLQRSAVPARAYDYNRMVSTDIDCGLHEFLHRIFRDKSRNHKHILSMPKAVDLIQFTRGRATIGDEDSVSAKV
jgi:hypothetical protein